jgi:hypothetical protein
LDKARVEGVEVAVLGRRGLLAVADLFWSCRCGGVVGHRGEAGWGGCGVGLVIIVMLSGDGRHWRGSEGWDVAIAAVGLRGRWWYAGLG